MTFAHWLLFLTALIAIQFVFGKQHSRGGYNGPRPKDMPRRHYRVLTAQDDAGFMGIK